MLTFIKNTVTIRAPLQQFSSSSDTTHNPRKHTLNLWKLYQYSEYSELCLVVKGIHFNGLTASTKLYTHSTPTSTHKFTGCCKYNQSVSNKLIKAHTQSTLLCICHFTVLISMNPCLLITEVRWQPGMNECMCCRINITEKPWKKKTLLLQHCETHFQSYRNNLKSSSDLCTFLCCAWQNCCSSIRFVFLCSKNEVMLRD